MRTIPAWVDKVHDVNKVEQCIYDLCFNPNGSQLVVAAGQIVQVYNTIDGSIIKTLKGHKDTVYCVSYSHDGTRFASGGADKTVIIWTYKLESLLKYVHNDAIQCLEFNSISNVLASCAISDFAFWTLEQKSVSRYKVPSRINACSWNSIGEYLALGLGNGNVSIRNAYGDEKLLIERESLGPGPPIWALSFSPRKEESDILCVTDWSQKMTFYTIDGKDVGRERNIGFEALSVSYMSKGDYILLGGCNNQCVLMSNEGVKLSTIGDEQESWIWSCKAHPSTPFVVFGCQDGTVAYFQLVFSTVHDLYREKYAFRENMTDVVVQHLLTNKRIRIKCRDWVKKIAVYKHKLAVLLPMKIVVYELNTKDGDEMHHQVKQKLRKSLDCNLMVVCSEHLIFCQGTKIQCFKLDGENAGQWTMDDVVQYMRVVGGPSGNEGLIVGLVNGQVLKIYLNNPFPISIMKTNSAVICLDLSISKRKLAVVNEDNHCIIFDVVQNKILYQETKATSVAWNALYEDMLCFSGQDVLNIKIEDCQPHQMKFAGRVVGVYGSKAFSLNGSNIVAVDVPLSTPMYHCLEKKMYSAAYQIACLGVTDNDWKALAHSALEGSEFNVAIKAFTRIKDLQHLELIYEFLESGSENRESFLGDLLAYEGKFKEAGKMYQKAGESHKAVAMFSDMCMFDLAQEFVKVESNLDKKSLIRKKAEWAKNVNDPKAATDMFLAAGDVVRAVDIAIEFQLTDLLINLARKLDKIEVEALRKIADYFSKLGEMKSAIEVYNKLGEQENVLRLYIETKNWSAAFALVEKYPQYESMLYMPYAQWLVENDKFVDAQKAFHKAGKPEEATKVLQVLIENAVDESRFDDTGYYHWILSRQYLDLARIMEHRKEELIQNFYRHDKFANIYYAYHAIQRYLEEPFTSYQPEALFNIARYLLNETKTARPKGVAQFSILYSLAKQSKSLGGFKIARQALDAMQNLRIPVHFQNFVDMATVLMKAKPYHDNEELLIMCYRCSSYNPLVISAVSAPGNSCMNCRQPFLFSFVTFEVLPLIEFQLEDGISDEEAVQLLQNSNDTYERRPSIDNNAAFQTLLIEDSSQNVTDLFTSALINLEVDNGKYTPVVVGRETLLSMDSSLVLVCQWPKPLRYRFYKNLVPELQIIACPSCFKVFHIDDYEMEVLQKGHCPFCKMLSKEHVSRNHLDS